MSEENENFRFSSINETEDFNGYGDDADRHAPPPKKTRKAKINKYGVRERTASQSDHELADDEEIKFSVNWG